MDMLIESGLSAYIGKVNMDRNCPDSYRETTLESLEDTIQKHLLLNMKGNQI